MGEPNYKFQDYFTGFPIFRGAWQAPPSSYNFFLKLPSIKTDYPHEGAPPLKNEAPHLKNNTPPPPPSPPLKHEAPFHEMIPRKSTINNNLKSS